MAVESTSAASVSTVTVRLKLNEDVNVALTEEELARRFQVLAGLHGPGVSPGAGGDDVAGLQRGRAGALAQLVHEVQQGAQRAVQHVGARALVDALAVELIVIPPAVLLIVMFVPPVSVAATGAVPVPIIS